MPSKIATSAVVPSFDGVVERVARHPVARLEQTGDDDVVGGEGERREEVPQQLGRDGPVGGAPGAADGVTVRGDHRDEVPDEHRHPAQDEGRAPGVGAAGQRDDAQRAEPFDAVEERDPRRAAVVDGLDGPERGRLRALDREWLRRGGAERDEHALVEGHEVDGEVPAEQPAGPAHHLGQLVGRRVVRAVEQVREAGQRGVGVDARVGVHARSLRAATCGRAGSGAPGPGAGAPGR